MARLGVRGNVNSRDVERLIRKIRRMPLDAQKELVSQLEISAHIVRNAAIEKIRTPSPSRGPVVRYGLRRVVHPALADNPPNFDTGTLANNIFAEAERDGLAWVVVSRAAYSKPLEFGFRSVDGSHHGPWPFLFPALEENRQTIRERIAQGVKRAFLRAANSRG